MFLYHLFRKKKLKTPIDLSVLKVDMHSHILPGIDDGARDLTDSIEMVRKLSRIGFKKLITTPHIMADNYKNTPATINKAKNELNYELKKENISIEIEAAAEYFMDEGLIKHVEKHDMLTMGKNLVLIELPYFNEPPGILEIFFELNTNGYKVILAHPERYIYWYNDLAKFEKLKDRDVFFQLNILTFADQYPYPARKIADSLIDMEMIEYLGTDIHNCKQYELLEKALYDPKLNKLIESGKLKNHLL